MSRTRRRPGPLFVLLVPVLLSAACASRTAGPPAVPPAPPSAPAAPTGPPTAAAPAAAVAEPAAGGPPSSTAAGKAASGPAWARGAVFYEVFVRSFQDSDGDGVGDLKGLIARLDALNDGDPARGQDLGVDGLWLMPVFESPSYHGYDTVDYDTIDREYGSNDDFTRLCGEAHKRGLKVILDLVVNHSSDQHPWFVESASSPAARRRAWYVWRADDPGWTQPWGGSHRTWHPRNGAYYYGVFWGGMPDLNLMNPDVRAEVKRIAKQWLDRGADGFRLDAARHAVAGGPGDGQNDQPETFAFWKEFADYVRSVQPEALLVGENWTDTSVIAEYYSVLPMNFNFPLAAAVVDGVRDGSAEKALFTLAEMQRLYPEDALDAPFLTNHDMIRVATQLGNDPARLRVAAAILLTLPGTPFLYYGEEVGTQNIPGREDEKKRTPMSWDGTPGGGFTTGTPWYPFAPGRETANVAAQRADAASLLTFYRTLIAARRASAPLRLGALTTVDAPAGVLAFERESGGERVFVAHNLGAGPATLDRPAPLGRPLFVSAGAAAEGTRVALPAHSSGAWRISQ